MTTILLVEENPHQRVLYRYELEDAGYEVLLACSGADAVGILRKYQPHLMLVHPNLPDMQFNVFMRLIQSACKNVPIIVHSGDIQNEIYEDQVEAFVLKGSDLLPLKNKIAEVLKEKGEKLEKRVYE